MTSALSDAEFEQIQNQLLELKTENYALIEKYKFYENESNLLKKKCCCLEKDLIKYQSLAKLNPLAFAKTLQLKKDQKDKEFTETIIDERDSFQKKLHQQENEFKLTNDMLKQEILNLTKENDFLKKNELNKNNFETNIDYEELKKIEKNTENFLKSNNSNKIDKFSYALLSEKEQLEHSLCEINENLNKIKYENIKLDEKVQDLEEKNINFNHIIITLENQNKIILNENIVLKNDFLQIEKESNNFKELANKRKSTIDELQLHIEDISTKAQLTIENANKKVSEIKNSLNKELNLLKTEKKELINKLSDLQKSIDKNSNLEMQCAISQKEVDTLKNTVLNLNKQLEDYADLKIQKNKLQNEYQLIIDQLKSQISNITKDMNEKDLLINKLNHDLEDQIQERKIHDKKGVMYVRELQKQLNNEKKKREKLQDKLNEFLNEKSFDANSLNFDTKSVGSWSFLSSKDQSLLGKNTSTFSIHSSTDGKEVLSNGIISSTNDLSNNSNNTVNTLLNNSQLLEKENTQLVSRITNLQQEKWILEEKLNQSLLINQKLSSELELKKKVIQFYCMERRIESKLNKNHVQNEKFTVKKVVDFIKDKGDDNLKEINRKLLRMLEETLIKNMHLQTNLELLTNKIHVQKNES